MKQAIAAVISNNEVLPGVFLIWLDSPDITSQAQPGQFAMVHCGEGLEYQLRRPLSIHQLANQSASPTQLALLFTVAGKGTRWLSQRKVGDNLDLLGPLGNSYYIHPGSHNLLLLAGGIGIAPLVFLTRQALKQGYSVRLLLGASTTAQLYPEHLLPPEVKPIVTTEDGSAGKKGLITDILPDFIGWADQIFACGPLGMYQDMYRKREKLLKNKPSQVSLEVRMGCGLGVCYGCTVKTKKGLRQVCRDGPVFDFDDILWDESG